MPCQVISVVVKYYKKVSQAFPTRNPAVYNTENHHHTKAEGMQDIPKEHLFEFLVNGLE